MSSRAIRGALRFNTTKTVTTATYGVVNESVILCNRAGTVGITLPALVAVTRRGIFVADISGSAASNNITITPASGMINGTGTYVISENYGSVLLIDDGTNWVVASQSNAVSSAELGVLNGVTPGTAAASKAIVLDANSAITTGLTSLTATTLVGTTTNAATLNATGAFNLTDVASVNAAGTVIANATVLANTVNLVAGANDAAGVKLPVAAAGKVVFVYSSQAANGLLIYPQVNSAINGGTANAAINIEGKTLAAFLGTSATNWSSIFTVNA